MAPFHNIPSRSDAELVSDYKATSSLQVLGMLYERYMELVYGVCLKYLKEPEDAKDCVINIFEELIGKLHKYEVEHFKSWLYQVAKNHCLMRLRSQKKMPMSKIDVSLVQMEENVHLNGELEKEENLEALNICLGKLAHDQKVAVELFYLKGKCYNEIVEITGLEWSQVRSNIQNGRRNLKLCMEKRPVKSVFTKNG